MKRRCAIGLVLSLSIAGVLPSVDAAQHFWQVKEVFTNADGSVQFIEMFDNQSGENEVGGFTLEANSSGVIKEFTFSNDIPFAKSTANKHLLIATPTFAALPGAVTPDFLLPDPMVNGLFFNPNAANISITFSGSGDIMSFTGAALPKDGINSLTDTNLYGAQNLVSGTNSPTNIDNQSGSINLSPEPASVLMLITAIGLIAMQLRRRW